MKYWLLFLTLTLPFILYAQEMEQLNLQPAPLIPLEPQFPLGLTSKNRDFLIDNPEKVEHTKKFIQHYLQRHTFPWLTLAVLLGLGGIGWTLYLSRDRWPSFFTKQVAVLSPQQQVDQQLQALQKHPFNPEHAKEYYAELASILLAALQLRLGWKTKELTTVEVAKAMKGMSKQSALSSREVKDALSLLTEIDQVKFASKKPASTEAIQVFQEVQKFTHNILKEKAKNSI